MEDTWLPINYSLAIDYEVKSGIWDCCYGKCYSWYTGEDFYFGYIYIKINVLIFILSVQRKIL